MFDLLSEWNMTIRRTAIAIVYSRSKLASYEQLDVTSLE